MTPAPAAPATAHVGDRTACALATRTAELIFEVLTGRRTLHQIRGRLSGPVAGLLATTLSEPRGRRQLGRYRLGSVHACQTTSRKVEACAVLDNAADRARALVMRLEQEETAWSCTMLSLV